MGLTYWDAWLVYTSMEVDIMMSYWFNNARRMERGDPQLLSPTFGWGP